MNFFKPVLVVVLIIIIVISLLLILRGDKREDRKTVTDTLSIENSVAGVTTPGTYSKSLESEGRTRTYELHIPSSYDAESTVPLVFMMHGGGGDGARIIEQTKFNEKADAKGFILVAPDGIENNWNDGRGYTARKQTTDTIAEIDDVVFLKALVAEIQATYNIDPARIYIAGVSNGAMMAQRMICDAPGIFAAVGVASGPFLTQTAESCDGTAAVVGIQGTDDPFWPIEDGNGIPDFPRLLERNTNQEVVTVEQITDIWVNKNACSATAKQIELEPLVDDGTSVTHYIYPDCGAGLDVEYYVVTGMGHGWPPYQGTKLAGAPSGNLNATDVFWDFFEAHSMDRMY